MDPLSSHSTLQKRAFNGVAQNATIYECFEWIESHMDQRLFALTDNDALQKMAFDSRSMGVKKNLCSYETSGNKTRWLNANRLFYEDKNGALVDSGITRTETPYKVKAFFSWLLKKEEREGREQHLFNLVHDSDQLASKGYVPYFRGFYDQSEEEQIFAGKKGCVTVETTSCKLNEPFLYYSLEAQKNSGPIKTDASHPIRSLGRWKRRRCAGIAPPGGRGN